MTVTTTIAGQPATLHIQGTIVGSATIPVVHLGSGASPNDYATSVVATQGPVHIADPAATVTDASAGTRLTSMTVKLTNHPDGARELLATNVGGTGLTASYNASTGVETISGSAAPAVYQGVLRSLTYEDDALAPDTHDRVITVTVSDGTNSSAPRTSTITVYAPARALAVTDFPSATTAGGSGSVTVTALDANGNPAPGYTGRVHFTSSDLQAGLPADYTFTADDHGAHTFPDVVLKTATTSTLQSITAVDTADDTVQGTQSGIAVSPAAAHHFAVTTSAASPDVAGTAFDVTVTVQDAYNNTVPSYTGTVHFSSADPYGASLPGDYTFTTADAGTVTLPAGATLYTAGAQDVTVTDALNNLSGTIDVNVVAGAAVAFKLVTPSTVPSGTAFTITVVAVDAYGNTDTNYTGTIRFSTDDTGTGVVMPPDYTFQSADGGVATFPNGATLIGPGIQTIYVTDLAGAIAGSVAVTVV
jgi:hypothetical protein